MALTRFEATRGVCLGSDVHGGIRAQGRFEEFYSFARVCEDAELTDDYRRTAPWSTLGPVTPEEEVALRTAADQALAARKQALAAAAAAPQQGSAQMSVGSCAGRLSLPVISSKEQTVTMQIEFGEVSELYDVFSTAELTGNSIELSSSFQHGDGLTGATMENSSRDRIEVNMRSSSSGAGRTATRMA